MLDRRIEKRHPEISSQFNQSILGYNQPPQSTKKILEYIKSIATLNPRWLVRLED